MIHNVLFITGHDPDAERKVDLHFMALHLCDSGHKVSFITLGSSLIGHVLGKSPLVKNPNRWIAASRIKKMFWYPLIHPMKVRWEFLKPLTSFAFSFYPYFFPLHELQKNGPFDVIVIESGAGLALVPRLKNLYPEARFIYSVSDRLSRLNVPDIIYSFEQKALPLFDLIRVPSPLMISDYPDHAKVCYIPHGIERALFDKQYPSPYLSDKNAISIGDSLFDPQSISILAHHFPEWTFHLFGERARLDHKLPNVIEHGETRFEDIIPYICHADIGLALYKNAPDADYLSHSSLRMIQYSYCKLPIVTPHFSAHDRDHAFGYEIEDRDNLIHAFSNALHYGCHSIPVTDIQDWKHVSSQIFESELF
ncbi:MAG: hypothetical protein AUJ12_10270 [Alphaproteobacteria bacterium CG1_02_46_17]|nr:MAG: hypothetical protein AUJ12_10270 [Alphaproteobacteria bacterium CG1_02_46_17]